MRGWATAAVLGAFYLCLAISSLQADGTVKVRFFGYQQINGQFLFQVLVDSGNPANQPPLLKTGDRLSFGPYKVGAFHMIYRDAIDPATGQKIHADVSTLEIINTETGQKTELLFRRQVELTPGVTT